MAERTIGLPVAALRRGLYVAGLDRPWTETPFLFQGFVIASDADVETLRAYCRHVVVDVERSDAEALAQARRVAAPVGVARAPGEADSAELFGTSRFPDQGLFREMVHAAHRGRARAQRVVDAVMADVRFGRLIDGAAAREAVEEVVGIVSANAAAVLWLTNLKDPDRYTSIHCVNVCILALAFARHLELSRDELARLGLGALLLDVGKSRTPPEILNKPGPLTAQEFEIVKRHPEDGYRIVAEADHVAREALEVIRLHHERCDGRGYPLGLAGEQIPRHVVIAALADSYDALTSDRPHQAALSPDRALQVLYGERGAAFDGALVHEFIRCIGIFPVGSLVELDSGALGVVVASRPEARLQPTILLLRTPDGEAYDKRLLVNLAAEAGVRDPSVPRRIRRAVEPGAAGVDVADIVASEFGLAVA